MNSLSKNLTINLCGLGMLHCVSIISLDSFSYQFKDTLTKSSCIAGKIGHSKMEKIEYNKKYEEGKYTIEKSEDIKHT